MASKSSDVRPKITLACSECKERNYITKKNRRNTPNRLTIKKFCARCGRAVRAALRGGAAVSEDTRVRIATANPIRIGSRSLPR